MRGPLGFGAVFCAALFFSSFAPSNISPRLKQKLDSAIQSTFELEQFVLTPVPVAPEVDSRTPVALDEDHLFRITAGDRLTGYAYLGEAPSMKNVFDYVVLLNSDLSIRKSKVLIYREDYGRQIGSQRWLRQFIGIKPGEPIRYGEEVDVISGATISAKSMTKAVQEVMQSLAILKSEKVL